MTLVVWEFVGASRSRKQRRRPLDDSKLSIGLKRQCWSIKPKKLAPPPHAGCSLLRSRCEPILPDYGAHLRWRGIGERVACEQRQYVAVVRQQSLLRADY